MREKKSLDASKERTQDVIGLTLQLQKFRVGTPSHIRHQSGDTVLGHYDHLLIRPVRRWLDFSPRMDWMHNRNSNSPSGQEHLATHYPIKLLFPSQESIDGQSDFAYEEWKNPDVLLANNPCMTVVLLNLTDAYRNQAGARLLSDFLQLLRENCQDLLKQMRCCALPSLGYSDFCILMAGTGWKEALKLVDCLHGLAITDAADGNKLVVVLSTDYMLPAYHRSGKDRLRTYFDELQLMVRVNLCPGVTAQQLANRLPEVQVYRTSGGADCILSAQDKEGQQALMDFLMDGDTGSLVVDIVSTPQLLMTPTSEPDPSEVKQAPPDQQYIKRFEDAVKTYSRKLEKYNRHNRQINSLWELSFMIKNICSQPHTSDLRQIMQDLLESFSYCLKRCAEKMDPDWDFVDMEEWVNNFSGIVGDFLSDLSRSDCFFMEREKYNHASISSTTSLLIAYNQWLNRFTRTVSKATECQNQSKYTFLVTSGGRDQTQTMEAFYFLDPELEENGQLYEQVPLVTQMSEMSLFDFSGTILRCAHECMHFSGIRRRADRVGYLLAFITRLFSQLLASVLLSKERVYNYAEDIFCSLNADQEVIDEAWVAYKTRWEAMAKGIAQKLEELLKTPELKQWDEFQCLSKNVQDWIYNRLMYIFSGQAIREDANRPYKFHMNGFAEALYKLTQTAQRGYFEDCDRLCRKHNLSSAIFSYGAKKQQVSNQQFQVEEALDTAIQLILSRLLIRDPASSMLVTKDEPDYDKWELNFPYFTLINSNINDVLMASVDIFKEAFADVMACEILGADFTDYVLMHVFEDWDLDSALAEGMTNTYRIPAVLYQCYKDYLDENGQLTVTAHKSIEEALQRLELHGMPHRLSADSLCGRINSLLEKFGENDEISAPLMEYLWLCKSDYEKDTVKAALAPFAESYREIRLLAVDPREPDVHDKLLGMYDALIDKGGRLP